MATIKIIQRTKALANGLFPLFLRITKDRKSKFISLNLSCEKEKWNETKSEFRKNYRDYIQHNNTLDKILSRAEKIISETISMGEDITLEEFEEQFLNFKKDKKVSVNDFWDSHISDLIKAGRTGSARFYKDSKRSFMRFVDDKLIYFKDITPVLLSKYEQFLRERENSDSGIAVKMRAIRALYNDAINKDIAKKEQYPFEKYKVSKLKSRPEKRALSLANIQKIKTLDLSGYPNLIDSHNYFLFSYFSGGMNFYDMMKLQWENIIENRIVYIRSKTKGKFTVKISEPIEEILSYYKAQQRATNYIFPIILKDNLTPIQLENRKDKTLKKYNKDLKEIAALCGIDGNITSYVARHSFATNLKQRGVSTDVISEAMGHQNLAITQAYLKDLENDVIDEAMSKLL